MTVELPHPLPYTHQSTPFPIATLVLTYKVNAICPAQTQTALFQRDRQTFDLDILVEKQGVMPPEMVAEGMIKYVLARRCPLIIPGDPT